MLELLLYKRAAELIRNDISLENLSKEELVSLFANMNDQSPRLDSDTIADVKLDIAIDLVQKYGDLTLVNKISKFIAYLRLKREELKDNDNLKSNLWFMILAAKSLQENALTIASLNVMPTLSVYYSNYLNGSFDEMSFLTSLTKKKIDITLICQKDSDDAQMSLFEERDIKPEESGKEPEDKHISYRYHSFKSQIESLFKREIASLDELWKFTEFLRYVINLLSKYDIVEYRASKEVIMYIANNEKIRKPSTNANRPENQMVIVPIQNR